MDSSSPPFAPCPQCEHVVATGIRCPYCGHAPAILTNGIPGFPPGPADSDERGEVPPTAQRQVVNLDTRVMGRRVLGALLDLIPLVLLLLGFASMWGRLGRQADGSFGFALFGWAFVGFVAAALAFYFIQEAAAATTFGKWVFGLRVVTASAEPIGARQASIRTALRLVDGLPLLYLVGYIAARLDDARRRLGDQAAGSVVAAYRNPDYRPGSTAPGALVSPDSLVEPKAPPRVQVAFVVLVALSVSVLGAVQMAVGDRGFRRFTPTNQATLREALLTRQDILGLSALPGPVHEVSLEAANLAQNPDPRGACGASGDEASAETLAQPDAAVVFEGEGLLVMNMLVTEVDAGVVIAAATSDMREGCPPFYSETPYGYRQFNRYVGSVDLSGIGDAAVGSRHRISPEGSTSLLYVEQAVIAIGDTIAMVTVLSAEEMPTGLLRALAEAATVRAAAYFQG